jgi:CheY-like chemotaxis protein
MTSPRRILLAEPDTVARRLSARLLERLGHRVDAVGARWAWPPTS